MSDECGESGIVRALLWRDHIKLTVQQRKRIVLGSLALLSALMMGVGLYHKQYFVVFVFCIWLCAEALLLRLQPLLKWSARKQGVRREKTETESLWLLYQEASENADTLSAIQLSDWLGATPSEEQKRWALHFRQLSELKLILDCKHELRGRRKLQQHFVFERASAKSAIANGGTALEFDSVQVVIEAAVSVSSLLVRAQNLAENDPGELGVEAKILIEKILGFPFEAVRSRLFIDRLSDAIQKSSGIPFLMLNLLRLGHSEKARELGRAVLSGDIDCEEDLKSTLYWLAELDWFFKHKKNEILDHDSAIRYLYHLCFVSPDRGGFLEIDSQFASEFGAVNEIAEEGFLFKETLVEALLELWESYEGWFDGVFQRSLEAMSGRKSKIYDERPNWVRFWNQEQERFSREYLYVIEGNLSFAANEYKDAKFCYEKALELSPKLRSALFNLLMVSAQLKDVKSHEWAKNRILEVDEWMPLACSGIGNSYLLMDDEKRAMEFYDRLRAERGWERKTDFYISLFCLEQGFSEKALQYGIKAHHLNPTDSGISFHLSRCYSLLGDKERALEVFKMAQGDASREIGSHPAWLHFYQFTLERDSGRADEASQTLLKIPKEYFEDSEELEVAIEFAKKRKDLILLRHLKQ
jgi:tetratricopeptide (TPR) repeat protein